jgi:hypothetical protein
VVEEIVSSALGYLDGKLAGYVASWAVKQVMAMIGLDPETKALAVALRIDYMQRSKNPRKAWNLIN